MEYTVLVGAFEDARREKFTAAQWEKLRQDFNAMREEVDKLLNGRKPFHWPLEFPEVFAVGLEEERGFAAIVSNPPFQGGNKITGPLGTDYRDYLVEHIGRGKRGQADICAYFFLRTNELIHQDGQCGLLATNTISQGDTREVGLDQIITAGWKIPRAVPSRKWPGTASLEVAHIWLRHGKWNGIYILDEKPVGGITSFLTSSSKVSGQPYVLTTNAGKSFKGTELQGMGFALEPHEVLTLIEKDPRNRDVLFPFLNGEDLNSRYDQSPSRWVINFHNWPLEEAETYYDCMKIIREKVKPEREKKISDKNLRGRWWIYKRRTQELYNAIEGMTRALAVSQTSKYHSFVFVPTGIIYSHKLVVFAEEDYKHFALVQSSLHTEWVLAFGSTLETRPVYTPTDCFETFPFPKNLQGLAETGERYYQHRQSIMLTRQEGLTKTYNRFHNPEETAEDIVTLRDLHKEMDEAVARAYGWDDLDLGHGFHETKQGLRYTISEEARREVLGRLLKLNHERYAEEVAMGLHEKGMGAKKGKSNQTKPEGMTRSIQEALFTE